MFFKKKFAGIKRKHETEEGRNKGKSSLGPKGPTY